VKAKRTSLLAFGLASLVLGPGAQLAQAQPRSARLVADPPSNPTEAPATNFRGRFGMELVQRLLRSSQPEERLRGLRRAAELGTPESVALLASQAESNTAVRTDPRALLEVVRALAPHAKEEGARAALISVLQVQASVGARAPGASDDADPFARFELARSSAALALATSGTGPAFEALFASVRAQNAGSDAAARALAAAPPSLVRGLGPASGLSAPLLLAISRTEDLRAADILLLALGSSDSRAKAVALLELAKKNDARALEPAKTLSKDPNPILRQAAAEALVALRAKEAEPAVKALFSDEGSASFAVDLVPSYETDELVKNLGARATAHPIFAERTRAIVALSRCRSLAAAKALGSLVLDKTVESEAAQALGRMRSAHAEPWIVAMLRSREVQRLGARAYVLRVLRGAPRLDEAERLLARLASAADVESRAVGVFGRVALGLDGPKSGLDDKDARVRAAAAMATRGKRDADLREDLLARALLEKDPAARTSFFSALETGDPKGIVPSPLLIDRAESGEPEAALATFALARRGTEEPSEKVKALLASRSPLLRTHALLGLAQSRALDVSGRLANAYSYEPDPALRRIYVTALAERSQDASSRARGETLELAAKLDPNAEVRFLGRRALAGVKSPVGRGESDEVAWLRITGPDGRPPRDSGYTALLLTSTGEAVPVTFDPDGYALVPAVPPGETRLLLAPRMPEEPKRP
jgi:hypothetical protein